MPGGATYSPMERASMAKKQQKQASSDGKAERLRALRLAHEATRREAGIWGEMTVGEILHQASRSVFMQVWKGQRRPDPFEESGARRAGASDIEWAAVLAWIGERKPQDFSTHTVPPDRNAPPATNTQ